MLHLTQKCDIACIVVNIQRKKRYHAKGKRTMYYYNVAIFRIMPLYNSTDTFYCCLLEIYRLYQMNITLYILRKVETKFISFHNFFILYLQTMGQPAIMHTSVPTMEKLTIKTKTSEISNYRGKKIKKRTMHEIPIQIQTN